MPTTANASLSFRLLRAFTVLAAGLLFCRGTAMAEANSDYFALIASYVERVDNIYDGTWAYTYTVYDKRKQETRVRRVDPSAENFLERDVLLSVNGERPTAQRLAQHKRMLERRERSRLREGTRALEDSDRPLKRPGREKERFLAMLLPESIHKVKQEGDLLYLGFKAMEEGREHIFRHLEGLIVLDTHRAYIRELQLKPTGPFAPFFLTKVEDGFLSVQFELIDGGAKQVSAIWRLDGQALIIKNLDADMEVTWEGFEKVESAIR